MQAALSFPSMAQHRCAGSSAIRASGQTQCFYFDFSISGLLDELLTVKKPVDAGVHKPSWLSRINF
jgi:hypothetical protein